MKSFTSRIALVLCVLMAAAVVLPVASVSEDYSVPDPASCASPWWDYAPTVVYRTKVVYRESESLVESIPAEGYCYTAIRNVNVRSQPSIYATRVKTIRSKGTEFIVTARAKNSSGEIWYAVELTNGTLGYIRSDLLNTDHAILMGDPYAYESWVESADAAASESASSVVKIATPAEAAAATPKVLYVTQPPAATPTPILVYVTPEPSAEDAADATPEILFVTPTPEPETDK